MVFLFRKATWSNIMRMRIFCSEKQMADYILAVQCRKLSSFAKKHFRRKPFEISDSFVRRTNTREVRLRVTDKQTDKPNYSNPRCACAPRVNNGIHRAKLDCLARRPAQSHLNEKIIHKQNINTVNFSANRSLRAGKQGLLTCCSSPIRWTKTCDY